MKDSRIGLGAPRGRPALSVAPETTPGCPAASSKVFDDAALDDGSSTTHRNVPRVRP